MEANEQPQAPQQTPPPAPEPIEAKPVEEKPMDASKKIPAGILGILLGSLGIHKFILGYNTAGIIMLVITIGGGIVTCGIASGVMGVIGLIEGIIYLTKSDEDFINTYVRNKRTWF